MYFYGALNNCTLSGNLAEVKFGGAYLYHGGSLNNCIVWGNSAPAGNNIGTYSYDWSVNYTCSDPEALFGTGNIELDPMFVHETTGDFRLRADSPCIDSGNNSSVSTSNDLAGGSRVINETVDMGAYEFWQDTLDITPLENIDFQGYEGGEFPISSKIYTLMNTYNADLAWTSSWDNSWLTVSPSNGILAIGETTNITVSLTSDVETLPLGMHIDTIIFNNLTCNSQQSRYVDAVIYERVLDHFAWDAISPIQYVGEAFPVTITAMDATTNPVVEFAGAADIAGYIDLGETNRTMLNGQTHTSLGTVDGTKGFRFSVTDDLVVTHIRHYWGTKISFWSDAGELLLSTNVTSSPGRWTETALITPLVLTAGNTYRIAAFAPGYPKAYYLNTGTPWEFLNGTIISSCAEYGDSFPANEFDTRMYLVDFRYSWNEREAIAITPTNTTSFVNGVWTGMVSCLQSSINVFLQADGGSRRTGDSPFFDVLTKGDIDDDGILDYWEILYYDSPIAANPLLVCSNGVNTVLQAFIAGLNPNDPGSEFLTTISSGGALQWTPCTSGRVYCVQWSTNLVDGFLPLETNIPWTVESFTDTNHPAQGQLFYKIDVELEGSSDGSIGGGDPDVFDPGADGDIDDDDTHSTAV